MVQARAKIFLDLHHAGQQDDDEGYAGMNDLPSTKWLADEA